MGQASHLRILFRHTFVCIDQNQAYVGALNRHGRAKNGKFLDSVIHLGFLTHPSRVDEEVFPLLVFKIAVHRVPGGACHVGNDDPLLSQNTIDQGGFSHIGFTDDGHLDHIFPLFLLFFGREKFETGIQQIPCPVSVNC